MRLKVPITVSERVFDVSRSQYSCYQHASSTESWPAFYSIGSCVLRSGHAHVFMDLALGR